MTLQSLFIFSYPVDRSEVVFKEVAIIFSHSVCYSLQRLSLDNGHNFCIVDCQLLRTHTLNRSIHPYNFFLFDFIALPVIISPFPSDVCMNYSFSQRRFCDFLRYWWEILRPGCFCYCCCHLTFSLSHRYSHDLHGCFRSFFFVVSFAYTSHLYAKYVLHNISSYVHDQIT